MRLLAHIEEIDKKKWKVSFDPDKQGAWGATSKLKSKNKNLPQTKFDKKSVIENISKTYIEIIAMDVIDRVNKAFKMFGYKTDLMPIPMERDWHLSATKEGDYVHLTTSAFNKPVVAAAGTEHMGYKWEILQDKQSILNALISNSDTHQGNYVFDSKSQKNYAIDFGLAFNFNRSVSSNITDLAYAIQKNAPKNKELQKYARGEKYLTFWQGFLEHNKKNFDNWIEDATVEFLRKLEKEVRRIQEEHKYTELDLEELKAIVLEVKSDVIDTLENNAEELLNDLNVELGQINKKIKSLLAKRSPPSVARNEKQNEN